MSDEPILAHCNICLRLTKHNVLSTFRQEVRLDGNTEFPPYPDDHFVEQYSILECFACRDLSFLERSYSQEVDPEELGDRIEYEDEWGFHLVYVCDKETQYPPRVSRRQPDWIGEIDEELRVVLNDVYRALYSDMNRLAAMGIRAIIDMVTVREVGDIGGFESKLKAFVDAGLLSNAGKETLSVAIDAGSASAHRGYVPSRDDLSTMIDIVENILQALYVLKPAADRLKSATPQRPPRSSLSGTNRIVPFRRLPNQPRPTTRS